MTRVTEKVEAALRDPMVPRDIKARIRQGIEASEHPLVSVDFEVGDGGSITLASPMPFLYEIRWGALESVERIKDDSKKTVSENPDWIKEFSEWNS